ncbi:MAG: hypothetical protein ISS28_04635 [Candidatus Cloacimonetes bacterium]|nr:hypothetical protein [Candidatus Cloacimonadota bacterium]
MLNSRFFAEEIEFDITFICRSRKNHFAEPILRELENKYSIQYLYPEHKKDYSCRLMGCKNALLNPILSQKKKLH